MAAAKAKQKPAATPLPSPATPLDEAWRAYGAGDLAQADQMVRRVLSQAPNDIEAAYLAGLVWRAQGNNQEAKGAFQIVVDQHVHLEDRTRGRMLRRLAVGHLNQIDRGLWDLEPETWERA